MTPLFGWLPPALRTEENHQAHDKAVAAMPKFSIKGRTVYGPAKKVLLFDWSKEANGGKHLPTFFQYSGSCVGQGLGKAWWTLIGVQVAKLGQVIATTMPMFLVAYGKSRELMGARGKGEGSLGSTAAKAAQLYGAPPSDMEGLPKPTIQEDGSLTYGKATEIAFSYGPAIDRKWHDAAKPYLIRTVAPVRTSDDVREAIVNGYPCTIASNWGGLQDARGRITPCPVEKGVLLNRRASVWPHQMCVIGWWEHPDLGEIFFVQNSWGTKVHGTCPTGAPLGGFWVKKADMDYITRQGDSFAFSSFVGYPAQNMELDFFVNATRRDSGLLVSTAA